MKLVILAGGRGTRISEETHSIPKPMVKIGNMPIIWHIMKYYSQFGINDFIVCAGYKGEHIKEFFANYYLHSPEVEINLNDNSLVIKKDSKENWKITILDTGENSMTGGRLYKAKHLLENLEYFYLTYGDGLANVDLSQSLKLFKLKNKICLLTSILKKSRFGEIRIDKDNFVTSFIEKPQGGSNKRINGGFFILKKEIFDFPYNDSTIFEKDIMSNLVEEKQLISYPHNGFWYAMDTLRDKIILEELWAKNKAPWKIW